MAGKLLRKALGVQLEVLVDVLFSLFGMVLAMRRKGCSPAPFPAWFISSFNPFLLTRQFFLVRQALGFFSQIVGRCNAELFQSEPVVVNFCYPLMYMIAAGQIFEPCFYHPDADVKQRREASNYCLE